jgi:hypothetical protein
MSASGENSGTNPVVKAVKRPGGLLLSTLFGTCFGTIAALFLGPKIVGYWYEPTGREAISCYGPVREAVMAFVWIQVAITVLFTLLFLVATLMIQRRRA